MHREPLPLLALCLTLATLVAALAIGWVVSREVEARTEERVSRLVAAAGLSWVSVSVDGTVVLLAGEAPDAQAALAALNAARAAAPHGSLRDALDVAPRPPLRVPALRFALDVLRDEQGTALSGTAPNAAARASLAAALADRPGGSAPVDLARDAGTPTPEQWKLMENLTVAATRGLLHGRVSLAEGRVTVTGLPRNGIGRAAIERQAALLEAEGVTVRLDFALTAEPEVGSNGFAAERTGRSMRIVTCTMPDAASVAELRRVAGGLLDARSLRCRIDPAAAMPDIVLAAEAALGALAMISTGRVEIEGAEVRLVPGSDSMGEGFTTAAASLRAALPSGFSLVAPPPDGLENGAGEGKGNGGPWLRARLSAEGVELAGPVPDAATQAAVASYAAARFGAERVRNLTELAEAAGPEGWRIAALAAIDALTAVDRGEALVRDRRLRLWGVAAGPGAARDAEAALGPIEAAGWTATTRITVDLPSRVAALKLPPADCIARLQAVVGDRAIRFAPSSASIEAESTPVLDALAEVLDGCQPLRVEVGGHTDSQGSAAYNNRLSQARAEAVREALVARGAPGALLSATGYGPSRPLADNRTEAGRALNRRIAFRSPDAEAAAEPAAAPVADAVPAEPAPPPVIPVPRP